MIQTNRYYEAFIYYFGLAKKQQELCNLGSSPYSGSVPDDLMCKVELYDVVERKYAGFSQLVNDIYYGWTKRHPYWEKMQADKCTMQRRMIAQNWTGKDDFGLAEWLYVMLFHRITGSGINYAKKPSGYNNTLVPHFYQCRSIEDMVDVMLEYDKPFYTSVGYQFPQFPKLNGKMYYPDQTSPPKPYKRAGDAYLAEHAPYLIRDLVKYIEVKKRPLEFRELGSFMLLWNVEHGLKQYHFQYAAFVADIADWFPELVIRDSMFYYGSNAKSCCAMMMSNTPNQENLDLLMEKAMNDTGGLPYNLEDVMCDTIRWVENYIKPGADYDHLDRDQIWSSCPIKDHPFGRQKAMLDLGLVKSFNNLSYHPTGDRIIKEAGLTPQQYKDLCASSSLS